MVNWKWWWTTSKMVECGRLYMQSVQQWGDDWLTRKLCIQVLRKYPRGAIFPSDTKLFQSLLRPVLFAFERHKILRLLFGTPLMFTKLCSSPSAPDTAHFRPRDPPLPSHQCPPLQAHIPGYQMLFCIWCKQLFEQSQRKCFMVNSWTFSVTCSCGFGSFFVRPAEMNCPVDLSDVSYKPLSPSFSG